MGCANIDMASRCPKLPLMRSVCVDTRGGGGVKETGGSTTPKAFLRPKDQQKCHMILDATAINQLDKRRPTKF